MPVVKPQSMKSMNTINLQPERMSSRIHLMLMMDIGGATGNQIAKAIGITAARVSIIRNSPMFQEQVLVERAKLEAQVIAKKSDAIVDGDPIELKMQELAVKAVGVYEDLLDNGQSEFVKKTTSDQVLDRAGYKARTEATKISIELTDKMAERITKVFKYEPRKHDEVTRESKIRIETTVSE